MGAWVTTPVDRDGPEPPGPGLVEEQPPDDGRVATVDPLIGLLGMQVQLFLDNALFCLKCYMPVVESISPFAGMTHAMLGQTSAFLMVLLGEL